MSGIYLQTPGGRKVFKEKWNWTKQSLPNSLERMPGWLKGMVLPTLLLMAAAMANAVARLLQPDGASMGVELLKRLLSALVIANWVMADARKRRRPLGYDFGSFVFFAPLVFGVGYVIQTRRWRAALTFLWFFLIFVLPEAFAEFIGMVIR